MFLLIVYLLTWLSLFFLDLNFIIVQLLSTCCYVASDTWLPGPETWPPGFKDSECKYTEWNTLKFCLWSLVHMIPKFGYAHDGYMYHQWCHLFIFTWLENFKKLELCFCKKLSPTKAQTYSFAHKQCSGGTHGLLRNQWIYWCISIPI